MSIKKLFNKTLLFLLLTTFTYCSLKAQNQTLESGTYFIRLSNSDLYLDADINTVNKNGGGIHLWNYNGGQNQAWQLEREPDGYYNIYVVSSGKCLDAPAYGLGAVSEGGKMQVWHYNSSPNQHWRIENVGPDQFVLIVPNTKLCVEANAGSDNALRNKRGCLIDLWTYYGPQTSNEVWTIIKSTVQQPGHKTDDNN